MLKRYSNMISVFSKAPCQSQPLLVADAIYFATTHQVPDKLADYANSLEPPCGYDSWKSVVWMMDYDSDEPIPIEQIKKIEAIEDLIWKMPDFPDQVKNCASSLPKVDAPHDIKAALFYMKHKP